MLTAIDNPRSFWLEARSQMVCAVCEQRKPFDAHHVLTRSRCKREGLPLWSPDNALRLCAKTPDSCHERHTRWQRLVPLIALRDTNIEFVAHWLGDLAAYSYLRRYYDGYDPRVEALLLR
jgi:hypothetical protein